MKNKVTNKNLEKIGNDSASHYHINGGNQQLKTMKTMVTAKTLRDYDFKTIQEY